MRARNLHGRLAPPTLVSPSAPSYRPAWWIPGGHLRTLWGRFLRRRPRIATRQERWATSDGDFLDLVRLDAPPDRPRLIILHGLEGSARSHYAVGLMAHAHQRRWAADVMVFRSCGEQPNRLLRSYHSGATGDLAFVVQRLVSAEPDRPLLIAGVSLGGNVLLKWLGECGDAVPRQVVAAAAVSVPFDLARGSRRIGRGFSRVYQAYFLRTLRRKAVAKQRRFPDELDPHAIARARTLWAFDDVVTAPVHRFRDARDYYEQSSSLRWMAGIRVPTLLLSARDDPFLPADVLDEVAAIARRNPALHTEFVNKGGHVGFIAGTIPWHPTYYAEQRVTGFLQEQLPGAHRQPLPAAFAAHPR